MQSSGILRRVALVRIDVSEERSASITRVTGTDELRTLAVTSNRRKLRINTSISSSILVFLHPDNGHATFLRNVSSYKKHGVTSQKKAFFIVTVVKTPNLT
jgi:hypothetical protein